MVGSGKWIVPDREEERAKIGGESAKWFDANAAVS